MGTGSDKEGKICFASSAKGLIILLMAIIFITSFSSNSAAAKWFKVYGDIGQIALPVAAAATIAIKWDKEGAIQFAESFGTMEAVTLGLKYTVNEIRPLGGNHSFPSGHTASAFAGASFLQQRYGWNFGVPAYVAATLVGISRITSHEHHWYDVVAGAAIGVGANLIFTKKYQQNTVAISPVPFAGGAGLMLSYSFK